MENENTVIEKVTEKANEEVTEKANEEVTGEAAGEASEEVAQKEAPRVDPNRRRMHAHLLQLVKGMGEIERDFPEADPDKLFYDRRFFVLTSPLVGLSPSMAYAALHPTEYRQRVMRYTAAKCAELYAAALQSGGMRPIENGLSAVACAPIQKSPETPAERAALRERIKKAAALGKKIFPS